MIKIEYISVSGFEPAIRGMRNPMNSWDKSDSVFISDDGDGYDILGNTFPFGRDVYFPEHTVIGENDKDLAVRLNAGGPVHAKYRRMITVWCDVMAPLYWWKEFDTYKVGTVANSCSTMHKIHAKEFELSDFSTEHLIQMSDLVDATSEESKMKLVLNDNPVIMLDEGSYWSPLGVLKMQIIMLNKCRQLYLKTKDKRYWWQMIQLLPSSYNQKRTIDLNYEVLAAQYQQRKDHKLEEWRDYCEWIVSLPYSEFITLEE